MVGRLLPTSGWHGFAGAVRGAHGIQEKRDAAEAGSVGAGYGFHGGSFFRVIDVVVSTAPAVRLPGSAQGSDFKVLLIGTAEPET